jgi:hypothetical protein
VTQEEIQWSAGFCQQAAYLKISLYYGVMPDSSIALFAMEQMGTGPPQLWRKFLAPRHAAVRAAQGLCADAALYLDGVSSAWRPSEDLDFDDFIEHIRLHVEGGMH